MSISTAPYSAFLSTEHYQMGLIDSWMQARRCRCLPNGSKANIGIHIGKLPSTQLGFFTNSWKTLRFLRKISTPPLKKPLSSKESRINRPSPSSDSSSTEGLKPTKTQVNSELQRDNGVYHSWENLKSSPTWRVGSFEEVKERYYFNSIRFEFHPIDLNWTFSDLGALLSSFFVALQGLVVEFLTL